ncbi:uncharacterized protein LOC142976583 [Anticarsia gemmatalis]|uniref:uncharacterized protein LOC142976583 n=1 Tax=Anticarsia gemmatalis TaxID=129554 RepID=UPI003F75BCAC
MFLKYAILFCVVLLFVDSNAFVKREVKTPPPDPIDSLKKNVDALTGCIDQSLAKMASEINLEKHLQPVIHVIGDHLNRVSKAFEDLTAPISNPAPAAD